MTQEGRLLVLLGCEKINNMWLLDQGSACQCHTQARRELQPGQGHWLTQPFSVTSWGQGNVLRTHPASKPGGEMKRAPDNFNTKQSEKQSTQFRRQAVVAGMSSEGWRGVCRWRQRREGFVGRENPPAKRQEGKRASGVDYIVHKGKKNCTW